MATSSVQHLLGAVRRRLWRGQFTVGVRLALWGSVGLMLLAVAVHLAVRPVPAGAVLLVLTALWIAMLARAGGRRPADADCALWADRHLGGASAFTTLLETGQRGPAAANDPAVHWLERWATARVPQGLRLLAESRDPVRLSRPLVSATVCAALATLVLTLPGPAPDSRPHEAVQPAPSRAEGILLQGTELSASAGVTSVENVASEVAEALRSAASPEAPKRRAGSQAPAAGSRQTDEGDAAQELQALATPASGLGAEKGDTPGATTDASLATGASADTGSGRQAGDSHDNRADVGTSRALQGTMAVQRLDSRIRRLADEQADMERSADYDDRLLTQGEAALRTVPAAAAATPPAAAALARLAPTEAIYVQAWMKANAARR